MNIHKKFALTLAAILLAAVAVNVALYISAIFPLWLPLMITGIVLLFTIPGHCDAYMRKRRQTKTTKATIVAKDVSGGDDGYSSKYELTFRTPEELPLSFTVAQKVFHKLEVGDCGVLTYRREWQNDLVFYERFMKK